MTVSHGNGDPGSPFCHEIRDPLINIGTPSSYSEVLTTLAQVLLHIYTFTVHFVHLWTNALTQ